MTDRSSKTPLPPAVPHHVADPTTSPSLISPEDLADEDDDDEVPATTDPVHRLEPELAGPDDDLDAVTPAPDDRTEPQLRFGSEPLANAFFIPLPENRRDAALARCLRRSVRAGTTVIRQGEMGHPLMLVVAGRLETRIERPDRTLAMIETIDAGQYVGEAALLARTPSAVQVIAVADSELLALPPQALFELAGAYPQLWSELKDAAERRARLLR